MTSCDLNKLGNPLCAEGMEQTMVALKIRSFVGTAITGSKA